MGRITDSSAADSRWDEPTASARFPDVPPFGLDELDFVTSRLHDVVLTVGPDFEIRWVVGDAAHLLGVDRTDMIGTSVVHYLHPDDLGHALASMGERGPLSGISLGERIRVRQVDDSFVEVDAFACVYPEGAESPEGYVVTLSPAGAGGGALAALRQRVAFEDMLTRVASTFARRPAHELDDGVRAALAEIGGFLAIDRAYVFVLDRTATVLTNSHEWVAEGVPSMLEHRRAVPIERLPNWMELLERLEVVYQPDVAALPPEWWAERMWLDNAGVRSVLAVPVADEGHLIGFVGFESVTEHRWWADDDIAVLQSTAGLLAQAFARRVADERFSTAFQKAPLGMALHTADGRHLMVNEAYAELLGRSEAELLETRVLALIAPEHRDDLVAKHRQLVEGTAEQFTTDHSYVRPDGRGVWGRVHSAAVRTLDGNLNYTITHVLDITDQRARELELQLSEERFRALVENSPSIVARYDRDGRIVYVSPAVTTVTGFDPAQIIGKDIDELGLPAEIATTLHEAVERVLARAEAVEFEWSVPTRTGTAWLQSRAVPEFGSDGRVAFALVLSTDITARKASEADLAFQALHDPLTGLANRALVLDRLQHALAQRLRHGGNVAVLFFDLDRFKVVNDSLGHRAGDELLIEVSRRLRVAIRPEDTVARLGGDEFVVILEQLEDPAEAEVVAKRVRAELAAPMEVVGQSVVTTASIGIALAHDGDDPDGLLRDADVAMYAAKDRGRDRYEVFGEDLRSRVTDRLHREGELRRAVENGELRVYYQPEADLLTGRFVGAEALVRWEHPERGLLAAGEFIELAEDTGIILDIGPWVLREACKQWSALPVAPGATPPTLRVNLSGRQIAQPDLIPIVARALMQTGLDPAHLCLEVTETILMADVVSALRVLGDLKTLGVQLAIDDFGTGYSSLSYLKRFPVDIVKIDQSFVRGLGIDSNDTAIVNAIVSLGHAMGLRVVAEGIETEDQLDALRVFGANLGEGYLYSLPVPIDAIPELMSRASMLLRSADTR